MEKTQPSVFKPVISALREIVEFARDNFTSEMAKHKVIGTLTKLDGYLCSISGEKFMGVGESKKFGEIDRSFEQPAVTENAANAKQALPINPDLAQLQAELNEIYPTFLSRDADELLDTLTDIQLRAVARKAGLPVTETDPEKLTSNFITEVKEAIRNIDRLKANDPQPDATTASEQSPELIEAEKALIDCRKRKEQLENEILPKLTKAAATAKRSNNQDKIAKANADIERANAELAEVENMIATAVQDIQMLSNGN